MEPAVLLTLVSVFVGVFAAIGMGTAMTAAIRRGASWSQLLDYAHHGPKPESLLRANWIRVGACRLRGCNVKVALSDEGLYLQVGAMVGPPLRIPWDRVREDDSGGFLLGRAEVPLTVRGSLARRIRDYLNPGAKVVVSASDPTRCPYCHAGLEGLPLGACVGCGTQHHAECLVEHGGCAVPGCEREPQREARPRGKERA